MKARLFNRASICKLMTRNFDRLIRINLYITGTVCLLVYNIMSITPYASGIAQGRYTVTEADNNVKNHTPSLETSQTR